MKKQTKCPICEANLTIPTDAELNEIISCPDCEAKVEIIKITNNNIKLEEVKVEEDWGE